MRKLKKNFRRTGRSTGSRKIRESIIVFCEGDTEEGYFTEFRVRTKSMKGGCALTVVENSKRWIDHNKAFARYDQLWVVFDKDESTDEEFNQAICKAKEYGLNVAYSNGSFELWVLFHFEKVEHEILRQEFELRIKKHLRWYRERNKGKKQGEKLFDHLKEFTNVAIKNAKIRFQQVGDHSNPALEVSSTTVFNLVDILIRRNNN